jgi:ABC-type Na+ transport system ATPase subunit NatA
MHDDYRRQKLTTFKAFFILELKRLLVWRKLLPALVFLLFSNYLVIMGIQQYNDVEKGKEEFRDLERKKVEQIVSYDQYGLYGFSLFFMPNPLSTLLYNSSHFTELTCRIDSEEKLYIYSLFEGKKIFEEKPGKLMDFSGIILILGSFISLFYGFDAFRHREYIKFFASLYGHRRTFICIWLSRVILLGVFFIATTCIAISFLIINGIEITASRLGYLLVFLFVMLMMQVFFFTMGTFASRIKSRMMAGLLIVFSWIYFVYLIPAVLNKVVEAKAKDIPSRYTLDIHKLSILMGFEKEVKKEAAKAKDVEKQYYMVSALYNEMDKTKIKTPVDFWKWIDAQKKRKAISQEELKILGEIEDQREKNLSIEELRRFTVRILSRLYRTLPFQIRAAMARRYLEEEFQNIQNIEKDLLEQMRSDVDFFQSLFSIFPTTFYLSTGNEISSRGYANIIKFYENAIKIKGEFLKFYVDHRYGDKPYKIVNFIEEYKEKWQKGKEANIFYAASRLPGKFGLGIGATLSWILVVLFLSYLSYKKALFQIPREQVIGIDDLDIELNKGESNVILSNSSETISSYLYNVLSGKNRERIGTVSLEGVNIVTEKRKHDFVYICHPEKIPQDIKAGDFVSFFRRTLNISGKQFKDLSFKLDLRGVRRKSLWDLKDQEKGLILLETALLKKNNIYMFYEFAKGMPADFIRRFTNRLQELKDDGASILYLTNDVFVGRRIGDYISFLKKEAALMTGDF